MHCHHGHHYCSHVHYHKLLLNHTTLTLRITAQADIRATVDDDDEVTDDDDDTESLTVVSICLQPPLSLTQVDNVPLMNFRLQLLTLEITLITPVLTALITRSEMK